SPDGRLVEIAELRDHPFMVGSQFHPEFKSRPNRPHPLFLAFIHAAVDYHTRQQRAAEQAGSSPAVDTHAAHNGHAQEHVGALPKKLATEAA
ncbi:MAG: hypothetical protein KDE58_23875, partial [Caldilineaceae bacterium]|nr:hypothetical protein [Caldilineaceae bacterium]